MTGLVPWLSSSQKLSTTAAWHKAQHLHLIGSNFINFSSGLWTNQTNICPALTGLYVGQIWHHTKKKNKPSEEHHLPWPRHSCSPPPCGVCLHGRFCTDQPTRRASCCHQPEIKQHISTSVMPTFNYLKTTCRTKEPILNSKNNPTKYSCYTGSLLNYSQLLFPYCLNNTCVVFITAHYLDQVDLMLSTEGLHQLDIHGFVAVGRKGAEMGLTPAKEHSINLQSGVTHHVFLEFGGTSQTEVG